MWIYQKRHWIYDWIRTVVHTIIGNIVREQSTRYDMFQIDKLLQIRCKKTGLACVVI